MPSRNPARRLTGLHNLSVKKIAQACDLFRFETSFRNDVAHLLILLKENE